MELNLGIIQHKFIHKPLLIGGKAMEIPKYHKDLELVVDLVLKKAYGKV
ncbi:hypothetical protein JHL18_15915 [Clostridium sp. YIM B02505]|uniref:Uncharacterized protein n=1 Tax=Clostridium yunnanense TaxID=2800325 RepID=A0ABS1ERT8_9CLOT|nr:hypothetical protein [Clostridium yunnanense]MBK1812109.1 hypothetical protein [Clostridium yunnanense]